MKANFIPICASLAVTAVQLSAATVTILPVTPYRSLNDSPWREAILAGDALKFGDQFCNFPATTLPSGLGVHDNFEDEDCLSPWLELTAAQYLVDGSVDADDGHLGETPQGNSLGGAFRPATQSIGITLEFIPTSAGDYPYWFGFAVTAAGPSPPDVMMQILGSNSIVLASPNLSSLVGPYLDNGLVRDDVFVGFIADEPITGIIMGQVRIDHFQYGYGTQPIPEPATPILAAFAVVAAGRRRRVR